MHQNGWSICSPERSLRGLVREEFVGDRRGDRGMQRPVMNEYGGHRSWTRNMCMLITHIVAFPVRLVAPTVDSCIFLSSNVVAPTSMLHAFHKEPYVS